MTTKIKNLMMESRFRQVAIVLFGLISVLALNYLFAGNLALAADITSVTSTGDEVLQTSSGGSFRTFIQTVLNFILGFLGLIAVGYLIYGGILTVTAGTEDGLEKGKGVIKNAVIGIIIIAVSYALVNTLLSGILTGTEE